MIYLDYSATTPVNEEVLETFIKVSKEFIGNANSLHKLGIDSRLLMASSTNQVSNLLNVKPSEIIFTSGATESNNLAIMGIALKYKNRGNHIITTKLEHSSVLETVSYLETIGYEIDYVNILENGLVDLADLKRLIKKETILVSITHVNSEVGIKQDIESIGEFLKEYKTVFFHVDGTQAIGKIKINLDNIDLYSFSAHKFYGLKGIGCLVKKEKIELVPLIHGGKSQTNYRSGTPPLPLIVSLSKALRLSLDEIDKNYEYVNSINNKLIEGLKKQNKVVVNSSLYSIPHIINISVLGIKPETMLHALEEYDIYISTKTACSKDNGNSISLMAIKKSNEISSSSLRISLSHLTTEKEIDEFLRILEICIDKLDLKRRS